MSDHAAEIGILLGLFAAVGLPALLPAAVDLVRRGERVGPVWELTLAASLALVVVAAGVRAAWWVDTPTWRPDARLAHQAEAVRGAVGTGLVTAAFFAVALAAALAGARALVGEATGRRWMLTGAAGAVALGLTAAGFAEAPVAGAALGAWGFGLVAWSVGLLRTGDPRLHAAVAPGLLLLLVPPGLLGAVESPWHALALGGPVWAGALAVSWRGRVLAPGLLALPLALAISVGTRWLSAQPTDAVRRHGLEVPLAVDLDGTPIGTHLYTSAPGCIETDAGLEDAVDRGPCAMPRTPGWGPGGGPPVWRILDPDAPATEVASGFRYIAVRWLRDDGSWAGAALVCTGMISPGSPSVYAPAGEDRAALHRRLQDAARAPGDLTVSIDPAGRTVQDVVSICLSAARPPEPGSQPGLACRVSSAMPAPAPVGAAP